MCRFNKSILRFTGVLLLSAYSLLLCEELFHVDEHPATQTASSVNDGTAHFAHRIITDASRECAICQSAVSQIHTETFHVGAAITSYVILHQSEISQPPLLRLYNFSLRAPPSIG